MKTHRPQIAKVRAVNHRAQWSRFHIFRQLFQESKSESDEKSLELDKTTNGILFNVEAVLDGQTSEGLESISTACKSVNELLLA